MAKNNIGSPILIDFWSTLPEAELDIESMTISHPSPGIIVLDFPSGRSLRIEQPPEGETEITYSTP